MKIKIKNAIVLGLAMAGLAILIYCIFCESESPFWLPLGMSFITIGNIIQGIFTSKHCSSVISS